jgi:kumamolisin
VLEFGGGFFENDLTAFCKLAKVGVPKVTTVSVDGTPTSSRDGAEGEVMLDVEVLAGVCPGAHIAVYFGAFTEQGWVDTLDAAIHDAHNNPRVLSISWGDSEDGASWTANALTQVGETLQEAALLGLTVCVAAGDDGSDDQVGDGRAHVDFPAGHPSVLAVGGTTLRTRSGKVRSEVVWKDGDGLRKDGGGSTGGGVSVVFPRPSWQTVQIPSVNPGAPVGRVIPDVAANASANTGYLVVVDGQSQIAGGTSAAAPLWAALITLVNASLGKPSGWITPLLYGPSRSATGRALGAVACRDIFKGNNNTAAVGGYSAKEAAFDAVSGWGVPIGSGLVLELGSSPKA